MTTKVKYSKHEIKCELAKRNFLHFLDFVVITEPRPDGTESKIKFEKWPHLIEAITELMTQRCLVIPKARQVGWSWLLAAWVVWKTGFNKNFKSLLFSQGEKEAWDLLGKCVYIWTNLPKELKAARTNNAKDALEFGSEWWIRAFPSTPKAGHGTTAGIAIFDEADFHDYLDSAYAAVKPTLDDVGGQIILVSKCNPFAPQSLFKKLARGAPENGFKCLFYPWNVRPNRTTEWYEKTRLTYADPFEFSKAYPNSLEEALESPAEMQVVSKALLEAYRSEIRPPITVLGIAKVWQKYVPGRKYIAASDVSHGVGLDKSVTVIIDVANGIVVADVSSRTTETLQFALDSVALLRDYGYPVWVIEDNDWGRRVIDRAIAVEYPRVFYRGESKPGWRTNDYTRPILWGNILDALTHRTIMLPNAEAVEEMETLIRNPDKHGRIEAAAGGTDDYMTSLGIALTCKDYAVRGETAFDQMKMAETRGLYKWGTRRVRT